MKNLLVVFALIFFASCSFGQPTPYQKAMGKALGTLGAAETSEALQQASNQFQRIAKLKPNEWLPYYYQALALGRMSFRDPKRGDELADEAQRVLDLAKPLATEAKDKAEIKTMQGMIYTAKLVVDPMSRGQLYSAMAGKAYQEALQLDPTNPRAKLMSIQGKMGAAQFFKQDLTPYINETKELLTKWDDFKPTSRLHPSWGKEMAEQIVASKKGPAPKTEESQKSPEKVMEKTTEPTAQPSNKEGNTVSVVITGLRNNDGVILITLQDANKKVVERKKVNIEHNKAIVQFDGLASGKYAIKYIHDENADGKLNAGFMGIPKEGYGFANDARGSMGPPDFEKTTFSVAADVNMTLKTKYH